MRFILFILLLLPTVAFAQTTQPATVTNFDLLIIDIPDLTAAQKIYRHPVRVDDQGKITLPYANAPITVAGQTLRDVEKAVAEHFRKEKIVSEARISIDRAEIGAEASIPFGKVAAGDLVRVAVNDLAGPGIVTVRYLHVSPSGEVGVPNLGQTKIASMTETEAQSAIAKAYSDAQMIRTALVSVLRVAPNLKASHILSIDPVIAP